MQQPNPFQAWMRAATRAEQEQLAQTIGSSRSYLYALSAADDVDYRREPKPALARNIEHATRAMNKATAGRLPVVYRTDLVTACRECEFAQHCLANAPTEFPVVAIKKEKS